MSERQRRIEQLVSWFEAYLKEHSRLLVGDERHDSGLLHWYKEYKKESLTLMYRQYDRSRTYLQKIIATEAQKRFLVSSTTAKDYASVVYNTLLNEEQLDVLLTKHPEI